MTRHYLNGKYHRFFRHLQMHIGSVKFCILIQISSDFHAKGDPLTNVHHWFTQWLGTEQGHAITWTSCNIPIYWRMNLWNLDELNTLRPRQHERHFPDDVLNCILLNENVWISIKFSRKFVPKGPNDNIPALVQIMAWHLPGDKPLSEPLTVRLSTHIWVTWPQWVNLSQLSMFFWH